jgi:hypothetical protein
MGEDAEDQETVRGTVPPTNGMGRICTLLGQGNFARVKTGPEGINPFSGRIKGTNARSAGNAGRNDATVTGTWR